MAQPLSELKIFAPQSVGQPAVYEKIQYPAGELQIRFLPAFLPTLFGADRISVICRNAHQHLMELALLSDALHHLVPWANTTLVLPYLPYARADRRFTEGDCHGLSTFGGLLNGMLFNSVRTLDVHSYRARRNVANLVDISARPFISRAIADICDHGGHPIVLLPDAGAARYGLQGALQASKKRDPATGKLSGFEVPDLPEGRDVLIVDDICDGGGTFIGLAEAIQAKYWIGCMCPNPQKLKHCPKHGQPRKRLYLYVTHGIFSRGLVELWSYFEKIYTTDSVFNLFSDFYTPYMDTRLKVFECLPELLREPREYVDKSSMPGAS